MTEQQSAFSAQPEGLSCILLVWAIALAAAFVALVASRGAIKEALPRRAAYVLRLIVVAASAPAAFFMLELPYNRDIFAMDVSFALLNIAVIGAAMLVVYFAALRSKIALGIFLAACFVAGVANGFVVEFRGLPVLLSDLLALSTAAEVAAGYSYGITDGMLSSFIILEVMLCALVVVPKAKATRLVSIASVSLSALFLMFLGMWYSTVDIHEEYDCSVDAWSSRESYEEQGALLCLLQRAQELTPQPPEWYSANEAERRRALTADPYLPSDADAEDTSGDAAGAGAQDAGEKLEPSIVVIMNETFSDLSSYAAIDSEYGGPLRFKAACNDALLSGDVYVSALGGSTCNSEYEFLTGASVGLMGPGIYPFMLYSMKDVNNIAGYLSALGYDTTAIHPAESTNWRRNIIYEQMGFDTFYDIESMRDADTVRGLVTDAATYDMVLGILESADSPQFIFDVTIANHGGYQTGEIPENERVEVQASGISDPGMNEYASLIERSDKEFASFLRNVRQLDRPVVVCMFGDHQSGYADILAEMSTGTEIKDMTLEQAQMRFTTPYIIWTNSEELRDSFGTGTRENMGLSYLSANVLRAAGLPLNEQFAFICGIQQKMPAVNLNGYMSTDSQWHYHNEDSISDDAYWELKIVQYNRLFDN